MPKNVIFHVGLPKTGTTTIQQYLRAQDDNLRSLGFLYPGALEHEIMDAWINHPLMFNAMMGRVIGPSNGLDVQACREVVELTFRKFRESDLDNLIWSYEAMAMSARGWDVNYLERTLSGADVRIVFFVRYTDDWVDSQFKEHVWARAGRRRAQRIYARPLRSLAPPPAVEGAATRPDKSMLGTGGKVIGNLQIMRRVLPSAEIVVRSFDANRAKGRVVSGALAAMGVPVEGAFPDADDEAVVKNPTKSDVYSMLLYNLELGQAGIEVIRDVAAAAIKRDRRGAKFEPLNGRRFRFLSDENIMQARAYYEELRQEYPELPAQPPHVSKPAESCLPRDEGVAVLDWLRPDISDAIFDRACAAYPRN